MPPTGPAYDIDWIWSFESNIHISSHRDWFTTFTPVTSTIALDSTTYAVEGIGSVDLEVRKLYGEAAKRNKGPKNSKITLKNVLYVPTFPCNVMGSPVREDYDVSIGAERWLMDKRNGAGLGLLDKTKSGHVKLMLKGQAKGMDGTVGVPDRTAIVIGDADLEKLTAAQHKT